MADFPTKMFPVSNEPSSAARVWVVVSEFFTVTVAPALTVIEVPDAKSWMVIVLSPAAAATVVELIGLVDDVVAALELVVEPELELELQPPANKAVVSTAARAKTRARVVKVRPSSEWARCG